MTWHNFLNRTYHCPSGSKTAVLSRFNGWESSHQSLLRLSLASLVPLPSALREHFQHHGQRFAPLLLYLFERLKATLQCEGPPLCLCFSCFFFFGGGRGALCLVWLFDHLSISLSYLTFYFYYYSLDVCFLMRDRGVVDRDGRENGRSRGRRDHSQNILREKRNIV